MGLPDIIIAAAIIGGALYLLYRSLWKKKGHCQGCSTGCDKEE
ncbi:MAG: FeoB-associated Cys-rich membrane protein [Thermodesulfobacteriota bacterium]|nr:MAG: FeoB-associated Cys-rich membrane protein [Thermodesulfobacteriota bacterium]